MLTACTLSGLYRGFVGHIDMHAMTSKRLFVCLFECMIARIQASNHMITSLSQAGMVFFECQVGGLCAQHCLNALFQAPAFDAPQLAGQMMQEATSLSLCTDYDLIHDH